MKSVKKRVDGTADGSTPVDTNGELQRYRDARFERLQAQMQQCQQEAERLAQELVNLYALGGGDVDSSEGQPESRHEVEAETATETETLFNNWKALREQFRQKFFELENLNDGPLAMMIRSDTRRMQTLYTELFNLVQQKTVLKEECLVHDRFVRGEKRLEKQLTISAVVLALGYGGVIVSGVVAYGLVSTGLQLATQPMSIGSAIAASSTSFAVLATVAAICLLAAIVATVCYHRSTKPGRVSVFRAEEEKRQSALEVEAVTKA